MLLRHAAIPLHRAVRLAEPVLLQGPRGAGKTTLARREFPGHLYLSLADPALRANPRGLLAGLRRPAILDEVQRCPAFLEVFRKEMPKQPLILLSDIRLSLPCATLQLQPPTRAELQRRPALPLEQLGYFAPTNRRPTQTAIPQDWRATLYQDLPLLLHPRDFDCFERFCHLLVEQSGTVANLLSLARTLNLAHRTVVRWVEVLERCFLLLRLEPYPESFGRRQVKAPKLHFLPATGCFESAAIAELYGNACHSGQQPSLYYWRDSNGLEIPLIVHYDFPIACLAMERPTPSAIARLKRFLEISGFPRGAVIGARPLSAAGKSERIKHYSLDDL